MEINPPPAKPLTATDQGRRNLVLALLLVAAATLAVYWPALGNGFIDFDDDVYVTLNMAVRQGITAKGFLWAFTSFHAANWHPLTWLSHMLDIQLFGLNPAGHHATSVVLHLLNSLLLCALLRRITGSLSCATAVALFFAVHPLHVESVAWVAERKDVLSTLFWLLAMWAYASYAQRPSTARYLAVAFLFALGLMAKQMLVTLPLILLSMDYWPLGRFAACRERGARVRLWLEKVPLLLLSGGAALVTLSAQNSAGALVHSGGHSLLVCAGNAFLSYLKYLGRMFWPADLALFYPFQEAAVTPLKVASAVLFLAAVSALVILQRRKRPYLLFGWVWYLVTLLPVIGFLRVGGQALADRYTYVPLIGPFVMLAFGGAELAGRFRLGRRVAAGVTAAAVVALSALAVLQIGYWQNSYRLFGHALEVVEGNWLAHNNIGVLLAQHNRNGEAIEHFRESVRLNPQGSDGYRNLGNSLQMAGDGAGGIDAFRQAVWLAPNDPENHFRLGYAYLLQGQSDLALLEYQQLLRIADSGSARIYAAQLRESIRILGRR